MKKLFALTTAIFLLASCGKKEEYKYNLTENGCNTGEKTAESKDQMCSLLKDNSANNGCAANLRKNKYEQDGCGTWNSN
jgi:hypothetical protein